MKSFKLHAALAVLAIGAGVIAVPAQAQAASNCWRSNGKYWCNNVDNTKMYQWLGVDGTTQTHVDTLRTTTSWFEGYSDCAVYPNGQSGPHPYRWIRTKGDDHGKWAWVSDAAIYNETNSLPNLGACQM
jgi:hypothetical protein